MASRRAAAGESSAPSQSARDPLVGTVINGKFRVVEAIARGGMGRIYYGIQAPLDRPVALKIVKADTIDEGESRFLERFLLEASILAKLQHPNVVTLFDYGRIEGAPVETYFIAMEYLDGETLQARLRTRGAMPPAEALVAFRQIARGLREAHVRGILHRDLKPSNIILVPAADGELVKLVDFGIGKIEREGEDLTRDGVLVGTPRYMAPEQFEGVSSPATDVHALGTIVYQMLTGALPFGGNTTLELMYSKLHTAISPMRESNPQCDVSPMLEDLVYRMLARRPEERPTLDEVFARLAVCEEEVFGASGARLMLSGTGARAMLPRGSRGHAAGGFAAPHTLVAPTTSARPPQTLPLSLPPGNTGMTPPSMLSTAPPAPPARSPRTVPIALALAGAVVLGGGGAIWLTTKRAPVPDPGAAVSSPRIEPSTQPSTQPTANPGESSSAVAAPEQPPPSFVLRIDSSPSGAVVFEDGERLGTTPLELSVDRGAERTFVLKKDGHVAAKLTQGPSDEARVEHVVRLTAERRPRPSGGGRASPAGAQGDHDIRLRR